MRTQKFYSTIIFISLLFAVTPLRAQNSLNSINISKVQKAKTLTSAEAQSDFDFLRKSLEEAHGGLYRFTGKRELDRKFDSYRKRLKNPLTNPEFFVLLSEMLGEIRDGHTRLEYDETIAAELKSARLFPFRVMVENARLTVLFNETADDATIRPGIEILSINNNSAAKIIKAILPKISGDGFIETGKRKRLERTFSQNYWLFFSRADEFLIKAKDFAGKVITVKISGVANAEREANLAKNPVNQEMRNGLRQVEGERGNVLLKFINEPDTAYLRIRGFSGDDFPALIKNAFQTLQDKKTKNLILDLRGNGGGVDQYGGLLVSQFMDKPFRYFDRIHLSSIKPSFADWNAETIEKLQNGTIADKNGGYLATEKLHSGVSEQQPAADLFSGKLFVLLDGYTFSTAADVAAILHNQKRAVFVGEESGGASEGNTSGQTALVTLPNSKFRLRIQMYQYWNAVSARQKGRGTIPDYVVKRRAADLVKGIDPQLEQAKTLARNSLPENK